MFLLSFMLNWLAPSNNGNFGHSNIWIFGFQEVSTLQLLDLVLGILKILNVCLWTFLHLGGAGAGLLADAPGELLRVLSGAFSLKANLLAAKYSS